MLFKRKNEPTFIEKTKNFIYPKKGFIRAYKYLFKRITRIPDKTHSIAIGVACGIGISMTPFVGLQILLTTLFCFILRGNILAGIIATAIGNPITFPFIWIGSYKLGAYIMNYPPLVSGMQIPFIEIFKDMKEALLTMNFNIMTEKVLPIFNPMIIGGSILGIIFGILTYFLIIGIIDEYKRNHQLRIEEASKKLQETK